MSGEFYERLAVLEREYEILIGRPNQKQAAGNGIFDRYSNPVLTAAHTPLFWRYDLNVATNPFLMERFGINAVLNPGAIKWNDKYLLIVRVEASDRKSFLLLRKAPTVLTIFDYGITRLICPRLGNLIRISMICVSCCMKMAGYMDCFVRKEGIVLQRSPINQLQLRNAALRGPRI